MDLDKYKKAWNNQPEENNTLSKVDIYKMAHAKSSSIVKWIFIIGLMELLIPLTLMLFFDMEKGLKVYEDIGLRNFIYYSQITFYPIITIFLYFFYKNYKNISTTDSTKILMKKILKTRKTVKTYVLFNIGYAIITFIVIASTSLNIQFYTLSNQKFIITVFTFIFIGVIIISIVWGIYQLLYGILLKKLNKNYKALDKLDNL